MKTIEKEVEECYRKRREANKLAVYKWRRKNRDKQKKYNDEYTQRVKKAKNIINQDKG